MNTFDIIKNLENEGTIYSTLENSHLLEIFQFEKLDKNTNLKLVYSESDFISNKIDYGCKLYSSKNGFYVFVKKHLTPEGLSKYQVTIYHLPEQLNEVIIFLKFINK